MKLLVVEDDQTTRDYIAKGFMEQGWTVDVADNGRDGLFLASGESYDVIVLDRMLPQMEGLKVLAALRAAENQTPVIILSALDGVDDRIKGLKQGGDDYLCKPFSFGELLVRAEILTRRGHAKEAETSLVISDLEMDLLSRRVVKNQIEIDLQPREFQLLRFLLEHKGQVISRTMLFESVWDYHFDPGSNIIDVHVAKLRKKLDSAGGASLIQTVRGAGYVLREPA
ncbi:response regulator transcription factor [Endozoicomonas arenosclerae]|uniref:winged helix-turn-helix domain-containing protein n=1 Tax=Endozoicomonas arenosclerae TaxID=1633495 RepID=UPI000783EE59|nr:response regulator transcription factor [Endozoicomonas arenosclerae]